MQYIYPSGQNSGRISESIDGVSGEDVQYSYDALQRLILAQTTGNGPQWGDAYAYDGFGNLQSKNMVTDGTFSKVPRSFNRSSCIMARLDKTW